MVNPQFDRCSIAYSVEAAISLRTSPCNGGDVMAINRDSGDGGLTRPHVHSADAIAVIVRDQQVAGTIGGNAQRAGKQSRGCQPPVATRGRRWETGGQRRSGHSRDDICGQINLADHKVVGVSEVEMSETVKSHRARRIHRRQSREPSVPTKASTAVPATVETVKLPPLLVSLRIR